MALLAMVFLGWASWQATRAGFARTLAEFAALTNGTAAADQAVAMSPGDAETHAARGDVLQRTDLLPAAQTEYEAAVQLRPRDYFLWLGLGMTRDQNGDQDGAIRAMRQSVALAPDYARPRWQLGNLLLRMGQLDEAFVELRKAATSDLALLPNVIDLAWGIYAQDAQTVVNVIQPENDNSRMALALFFARHNQRAATLQQFVATKAAPDAMSEALLVELLQIKAFTEAYQVWARLRGVPSTNSLNLLRDGGFESAITLEQSGFGWQIAPNIANVMMSVDATEHQSGARSLRIDFRGDSHPQTILLTQYVLVKPQTNYRISFAAQLRQFVSAAQPVVTVSDAADLKKILSQSPPLPPDSGWREFTLDFTTGAETQAIAITVARQTCAEIPCPAVGILWLDSFSVETSSANR